MSYKAILKLIEKDKVPSCILLYGSENYLIDSSVEYVKQKYLDNGYVDMNYMEFDKIDDFEEFNQFIMTFPFISQKKICVVKNSDFFTSSGSLNKKDEEVLVNIIGEQLDYCITIFIIKEGKPDSRKKIVKNLKDQKCVFEIKKLNEDELVKYIIDAFKKHNLEISFADAGYMANNSGYLEYESIISLYDINNDIDKISAYCCDTKKVTRDSVDKLMVKSVESNIFKLVDYICEGSRDKAYGMLEEMLVNNTPEQFIIHMIIRQYRMLYQYILLNNKGYSMDAIMTKMKIKKFIAVKLSKLSKNLSIDILDSYMDKLLTIDKKIKVGQIDKRIGLEIIANGIVNFN